MDKNKRSVLLRVLLFAGVFLFIVDSSLFFAEKPNKFLYDITFFGFCLQIILGVIIVVLSVKLSAKAYQMFIGMIISGWGLLSGLIVYFLPFKYENWWPLYLIITSVFLFVAGFRKYNQLKFGYFVPTCVLFGMGIWFSLFSLKVIKVSFKTVVELLGPAFICLIAILLVSFFFIQRHHKRFVIKDDESGDFDDEELVFPKLD